jgi:hypothetical protein
MNTLVRGQRCANRMESTMTRTPPTSAIGAATTSHNRLDLGIEVIR